MKKITDPKTAVITLHAGGSTLTFLATRKGDGVVTTVTTKDADKKATRGMTETHVDMAAAKVHLATLAEKAAKLGWQRRTAPGAAPKPDAFSKLPGAEGGGVMDHLDDDENVKALRETARTIGLTALLLDVRREQLAVQTALDRDRARVTKALELLGEEDKQ